MKHPRFVYKNYSWKISKNNLEIFFDFEVLPDIFFKPQLTIKNINKERIKKVGEGALENFIFHLGLIELLSYWKAFCPAEIVIEAGFLNKEQLAWWRDLIIRGMAQFFYENKINWKKENFLVIKNGKRPGLVAENPIFKEELKNRYLIPFSGGKDSIVTLEKLKNQKKEIALFLLNPSKTAKAALKKSGVTDFIEVNRKIDPKLFELNRLGYLNGHTPFTALLSFLSAFCGVLFDYKHVVFSNEKSADEGNAEYLGSKINHQYSKTSDFERKFKAYCQKYLAKKINYFSYLRPYGELEIMGIFAKYPRYCKIFSSCNQSLKTENKWCGSCPKCLFVYAGLYSFLGKKKMVEIFGKDLFEDRKLLPLMKDLIDLKRIKPFECVGTKKESLKAFKLSLKKRKAENKKEKNTSLPPLLAAIDKIK